MSKVRDLALALSKKPASGGPLQHLFSSRQEICIDVVEKMHVHVASNGSVLQADILGKILVQTQLAAGAAPRLELVANFAQPADSKCAPARPLARPFA